MQKASVKHILQNIKLDSFNVLITLLLVIIKNYNNVAARSLCQEWSLRLNHKDWSLLLSQSLSVISVEDENATGILGGQKTQHSPAMTE